MKRETPEEWERLEMELEEMGFKGGQGRSNHEVYESAGICTRFIGAFLLFIVALFIRSLIAKIFPGA